MSDKKFENLLIVFVLIFFLGTALIWKLEDDEQQEKFNKIEVLKKLQEVKQGVELHILLDEIDSLIEAQKEEVNNVR